ncbi:peptidyl-prolyl cis-trans isomerase A (cyclophilin A) [Natronobacterium texcoconense]|uniref:peptidylprolyl isomerase n=2 Tax=Natronobacterium texcoconense TaxID=1095778 RepID=A0A1H0ZB37_NATTX|nr:peptidyl-prolyl cis-trans isomerase A (cyclophilin A) [Natronobacterium texcoconense]
MPSEPVPSRRTLLALTATTVGTAIAGCSSRDETDDERTDDEMSEADAPTDPEIDSRSLTATLHTSEGDIEVELYAERVPQTVANFVGLATGDQPWVDPETEEVVEDEPLYDDVLFHRIIDDFMIQTGDPTGTGRGGPGYRFEDEFHDDLRHDDAGVLSMANSGPDTNGSQFFITLDEQEHLDGRHAVFGKVTDGMDVVRDIGAVETDENDRPVEDILLESVAVHDE